MVSVFLSAAQRLNRSSEQMNRSSWRVSTGTGVELAKADRAPASRHSPHSVITTPLNVRDDRARSSSPAIEPVFPASSIRT